MQLQPAPPMMRGWRGMRPLVLPPWARRRACSLPAGACSALRRSDLRHLATQRRCEAAQRAPAGAGTCASGRVHTLQRHPSLACLQTLQTCVNSGVYGLRSRIELSKGLSEGDTSPRACVRHPLFAAESQRGQLLYTGPTGQPGSPLEVRGQVPPARVGKSLEPAPW